MELSENELIARLKKFEKKKKPVLRGMGDDGAVVRMPGDNYVFVQDGLVEHIHFDLTFMDTYRVGKKAVYVNVSDILAMGALPLYFLVTLGIPEHFHYMDIMQLYKGMEKAAQEFRVTLIGGDTIATKNDFFVDVSMVGRLMSRHYCGRNMAQEGDLIGVTGYLGESAFGLSLLKEQRNVSPLNRFVKRYCNPRPPFAIWKGLMKNNIPHALMDISDGLLIDLERMMKESRRKAKIFFERLPIPRAIVLQKKENLSLSGGEDYQFLFTFSGKKLKLLNDVCKYGHISTIGEVVKGKGVELYRDGKLMNIQSKGYEHFTVSL